MSHVKGTQCRFGEPRNGKMFRCQAKVASPGIYCHHHGGDRLGKTLAKPFGDRRDAAAARSAANVAAAHADQALRDPFED